MKKLTAFFIIILYASLTLADGDTTTSPVEDNHFTCPAISALTKDPVNMTWHTKDNQFKSYNKSFASGLKEFIGAQWVGTNVGQVFCVYKGIESDTFPVLLSFHTLTLEPHEGDGQWGKDQGGFRNCASKAQSDCMFMMRVKPVETDIYKEAEKLRKPNDQNN